MRHKFMLVFLLGMGIAVSSFAQKVTVDVHKESLQAVFTTIKQQTGLMVAYVPELINLETKVTLKAKNEPLAEVLKRIFKGTNIRFEIKQKKIYLFIEDQKMGQKFTGTILDRSGLPIIGATIQQVDGKKGTVSDIDGVFSFEKVALNSRFSVSYLGYRSQIMIFKGKPIQLVLLENNQIMDEVVVVGYSKTSREKLISSVSTIQSKDLVKGATPNLENALSGKVSGVFSRQSSGEPGKDDANLRIRGFGQAMVVVDGIPGRSFNNIDPEEIASISVLKDAAASAVYGMQGANGVILVTTKRGRKNQKTSVELSSKYGVQKAYNYPQVADTDLWQTLVNEYNANLKLINNRETVFTAEDFKKRDYAVNTNWYDKMIQDAPIEQYNLKISGGGESTAYFISAGYLHQEGIWSTNSTKRDRYNFRSNFDFDLWKGLKASLGVSAILNHSNYPGASSDAIARSLKNTAPNIPVRWEASPNHYAFGGEGTSNPMALADVDASGYQRSEFSSYTTDFTLEYQVPQIKGLTLKTTFAYGQENSLDKNWLKKIVYVGHREDADEYYLNAAASNNNKASLSMYDTKKTHLTAQGFVNYVTNINDHSINAGLVFELAEDKYRSFNTSRGEFPSTVLDELIAGNTEKLLSNGNKDRLYRTASLIGRLSYDYQSKYFLDFNFRYDGAQYFSKKWGFFPSVSLGWLISKESFMQDYNGTLNLLKLRASWGKLGDLSAAKTYYDVNEQYYYESGYKYPGDALTFGDRTIYGLNQTLNANPDFTWSTSQMVNLGLDFGLWNGLLSGSVDAFYRNRTGLPAKKANDNAGALATWYNLNGDSTRGLEFSLNHENKIHDFSYFINANFSWSRTKSGYIESNPFTNGYANWKWNNQNRWSNVRWGLKCIGRYSSYEEIEKAPIHKGTNNNDVILPGDLKYEDWNKDGYIDENDYRPIERNAYPEIMYGFTVGGSWKGFDFSAFFQGAALASFEISAFDKDAFEEGKVYRNTWQYFSDRWRKADYTDPNSAWIPGYFPAIRDMNTPTINRLPSDFWFVNGSYIRLKNIEIGYTIPVKCLQKLRIKSLRIYASASNVFTLSSQPYFDPEQRESFFSFASYPQTKSYNVGLNLKF